GPRRRQAPVLSPRALAAAVRAPRASSGRGGSQRARHEPSIGARSRPEPHRARRRGTDRSARPVTMAWRIPVARPDIGDAELEAVRAVIERRWLTQGPEVRAFEAAFARFCGVAHAVATNTGTAALHVALLGVEIGAGAEVIPPPLWCIASANPILFQGACPVFADVDRDTYNLDPADVEKRITPRTKAILPVHLFGYPADMDALREIAERHGLPVIEDASQAAGAEYKGRRVGGLGRVAAFSLYANKIVTAGEGGMLTTPDARLAERM